MIKSDRSIARLLSKKPHVVPGRMLVSELFFHVPLNHANPEGESITLFGRSVSRHERPITEPAPQERTQASQRPYLVYAEGGPGFGNSQPQDNPVTRTAMDRGYQVLYLDYRGTGLSTPVTAASVQSRGDTSAQAEYLRLFRQDSIVLDLEAVRACLTADWPREKKQWSLFGQSFGGFVAMTYLSFKPEGLKEVFLTGGLAPVNKSPEEVYAATFETVIRRNKAYYSKFPEDVAAVRRIAAFIQSHSDGQIPLPSGGLLTVPRLLTFGLSFGMHGGLDDVHGLILRLNTDLDQFGFFARPALVALENRIPFDTNIIYAILHEPAYCCAPGVAANWAAYRVGRSLQPFHWLKGEPLILAPDGEPMFFSGEMIYPLHFETYPELIALRDVAHLIAGYDQWPALYDESQLRSNTVPVYAASFIDDMFVDCRYARETAALVSCTKVWESNVHMHNAVRSKTEDVFRELLNLRDDTID